MGDETPNNRITTAKFYEKLMENNERMDAMERRIMNELKPLASLCNQVKTNKDEIDKLRKDSNVRDFIIGIGVAVGTFFGITIKAP